MFTNANIPNAEIIHVPMDEKGKTKGMAYVQLISGVDVKDVLNQVKGLSQDGQRLRIFESKPPVLTFSPGFGEFCRNSFGSSNSGGAAFGGGYSSGAGGVFGEGRSDNNQRGNGFGERRRVLGVRRRGIGRSRGSPW